MATKFDRLKAHIKTELSSVFDASEIDVFLYRLVEYQLNISKIEVLLNPDFEISDEDELFFNSAIKALQEEQPIQYIIGNADFYGLNFKVTKATLIPRPETEELVDWVVKDSSDRGKISILDIGTGSGCIPISLAKNLPNAIITTLDVSKEAIKVAKENADAHKMSVDFLNEDILTYLGCSKKYDIIVSNPPYVRNLEKQEIKKNVLAYEPHLALFVADDDALIFYRRIIEFAVDNLVENGVIYFEINQYLGQETVDLMKNYGFSSVELRKDLSGNDRMLKASK